MAVGSNLETVMSNLKSLTFVAAPRNLPADPVIQRRQRLIQRLEEQQRLAKDANYSVPSKRWEKAADGSKTLVDYNRRVKPWWKLDQTGAVVLLVRSGFDLLEFEKGRAGVAVGAPERLQPVLSTLIAAAKAGELDGLLKAAGEIKRAQTADGRS